MVTFVWLIYAALALGAVYFNLPGIVFGLLTVAVFLVLQMPVFAVISAVVAVLFFTPLRRFLVSSFILGAVRKLDVLPKISDTEKIALDAGTTWVEGEFFKARPNIKKILNEPYEGLTAEEQAFLEKEVEEVCAMTNDWEVVQTRDLSAEVWKYLKEKRFFAMIIPKKYGGLEFSALGQSAVVGKLGSRSQVLSITTMVPNSLGPGELLLKYGTEAQKDYYLPRLADGRDIPCFGLTEPSAGTDAASIKSRGVLFKAEDGSLKIRLNFEKRYITLGGVATVIGLAFVLEDPENLLKDLPAGKLGALKTGITCALVKGDTAGITRGRRHLPLYIPFINSPIWGKDVIISVEDDVIGGHCGLGHGWKMLMECLAVGRGISLPAISAAAAKMAAKVSLYYCSLRRQFGLPLAKFEAVEERLALALSRTYAVEALRNFTATAVKNGHKPSVTNAIAKYHASEDARQTIMDAMDVLGGSAICVGPNNLIAHGYMGIPVAITVEGANIMTRSLLQFGQGLMRCHPFLYNEMVSIQDGNLAEFDRNFFGHAGLFFTNRVRWSVLNVREAAKSLLRCFTPFKSNLISYYTGKMELASGRFALLADLTLLIYGGDFKKKEKLSGRFADVLSSLYLTSAVLRKFKAEGEVEAHRAIVELTCERYMKLIDDSLTEIYANLSQSGVISKIVKFGLLLLPPCKQAKVRSDKLTFKTVKTALEDPKFRDDIFSFIYVSKNSGDRLAMLEKAFMESGQGLEVFRKMKKARVKDFEKALEAGVLTKDEYEFIKRWDAAVSEIVQVDHFELKSNAHAV